MFKATLSCALQTKPIQKDRFFYFKNMNNILNDNFGRMHNYLRISVTDKCNLRCKYCMPAEGIKLKEKDEILTFDEIEKIAKIFVSLGVKKSESLAVSHLFAKIFHRY